MTALVVDRPDGSKARVDLSQGDITRFSADAIVNAANASLAGGGGVDGAIHRAGGPELMAELERRYDGCAPGSAVITGPGKLSANGVTHVIHAVGPRWRGGGHGEAEQLASAYRTATRLAREAGDRTIAYPAISAGIYAYPLDAAAAIALRTVAEELREPGGPERATFVLYTDEALSAFEWVLQRMVAEAG